MKPDKTQYIIIVSAGRTGTEFLAQNLLKLDKNIYSIHEADRLPPLILKKGEFFSRLKQQGVINLLIKKPLGFYGARNLSYKRIQNKISSTQATSLFFKQKKWWKEGADFFIESNHNFFGIVKDLALLKNMKIVYFVRDPRDWISSLMNKGGFYDEKDWNYRINFLGFKRLTPDLVGEDNKDWENYDLFEKLAWNWSFKNNYIINTLPKNKENIAYFKFESFFKNREDESIEKFLNFTFGNKNKNLFKEKFLDLMNNKVNSRPSSSFPDWTKWNVNQCKIVDKHCGAIMKKYSYGNEPEWIDKLNG